MLTKYEVLGVDGSSRIDEVEWSEEPGFKAIDLLVRPLIGCKNIEHVTVLDPSKVDADEVDPQSDARDLFVDEIGQLTGLPRNDRATEIYRGNWLRAHPGTDPESLPTIVGTVVWFPDRRIWF